MSGSRGIVAAYGVVGACSVATQFSLARVTLVSLSGSELGTGMFVSFWVLSGGLGCVLFRLLVSSRRPPLPIFADLLLLLGLLIPASSPLIIGARALLFGTTLSLPLGRALALAALAAFPVSFVLGMLYAAALRAAPSDQREPTILYLADAAGSCAGGLVASFLLAPRLPSIAISLLAASVVLATGAAVSVRGPKGRIRTGVCAASAFATMAVLATPGALDRVTTSLARARFPGVEIVASIDSRYQSFTATRSWGSLSFYQNGTLTFFSEAGEREEEIAHIALASRENPRAVLILGNGWPFLPREVLKHPVASVDLIVEDAEVHRAGLALLSPAEASPLSDPRLRIRYGDPQALLGGSGRYDVVLIDTAPPDTLLGARMLTVEFLERVRTLLSTDGIVVLTAPSVRSYLSPALASLNASLLATLKHVFGFVTAVPGEYAGNILVAPRGDEAATWSPESLAREVPDRMASRGVTARWINNHSLAGILDPDRMRALERGLQATPGILNTRKNLAALLFSLEYRQELAGGRLSLTPLRGFRLPYAAGALLVLAAALIAVGRRARRDTATPSCAMAVGFSGMTAELALLCVVQVVAGNLYSMMAALVGLHMAGMAAGSLVAMTSQRRPCRPRIDPLAGFLTLGLASSVAAAALAPGLITHPPELFFSMVGLAVALLGFCSGGACSVLLGRSLRPEATYGADLAGGAIGGALVSAILLPVFGLSGSLWFPVLGYGFALLILGGPLGRQPGPPER